MTEPRETRPPCSPFVVQCNRVLVIGQLRISGSLAVSWKPHKFQGAEVARLWREASAAAHQALQHWQKSVSGIWKHHGARATAAKGT